jgi:hypothetical protein
MCYRHHCRLLACITRILACVALLAPAAATGGSPADASVVTVHNLDAPDHFVLEAGGGIFGHGAIDGNVVNQGAVIGDGFDESERIVFSPGWTVSGSGGFENTLMLGTFAPGDIPTIITGTNQGFGGTVEIELGGLLPGPGSLVLNAVPEPGSIVLLLCGVLAGFMWRRRRR